MSRTLGTRILVGFFFFVAIVLLVWLTTNAKNLSSLLKPETILVVYFPEIGMLRQGDPVRIAGLEIGEIKSLQLNQVDFVETHEHLVNQTGLADDRPFRRLPPSSTDQSIGPPKRTTTPEGLAIEVRRIPVDYKVRAELSLAWETAEKEKWLAHDYVIYAKQATFIGGMYVAIDPAEPSIDSWARKVEEGTEGRNFGRLEVAPLEKVGDWFKESGDKIGNALERIDKGEGTLGLLIRDRSLHDEAKKALQTISEAADRFRPEENSTITKLMKDEGKLFEKLETAIDNIARAAESMKPNETS
ncbi:MAG: MlaD family protein, partial [Planctomycetota bacterium]|nr:MlaD family protein [Planctomycetota bacterium]